MGKGLRVAVVGVGNRASRLIQGRHYQNAAEDAFVPGLVHVGLGDDHVRDIGFVAAFDVNAKKVGLDQAEAIRAKSDDTVRFMDVPDSAGVITDTRRCATIGLDRGLVRTLVAPSAYFIRSPPEQLHDDVARERVEAFIAGEDDATPTGSGSDAVEETEAVLVAASEQQAATIA